MSSSRSTQIHYGTNHIFDTRSDNSDIILSANGSRNLIVEGTFTGDMALTDGKIWIGNPTDIAQQHFISGDATLDDTGNLTLIDTSVTPGSYTNTNLTVDSKGRITAAANGSGGGVTPAALTKTDDTNVTLTLGGTPSTALLQATSMTLGWTGLLALSRGGTNNMLTANNGGIVWSDSTKLNILAGTATAKLVLCSGSSSAPSWDDKLTLSDGLAGTPTYSFVNNPMTGMYSPSTNVVAISINGIPRFRVEDTYVTINVPIRAGNGTNVNPTYTFLSSTYTGMYSGSLHNLDFCAGLVHVLNMNSTSITPLVPITGYLSSVLNSGQILVGNGSNVATSVSMSET